MRAAAAALLLVAALPAGAHDAIDTQHVRLEIRLDPARRAFEARATLRLRMKRPAAFVELDAVELDVRRVSEGGRELGFETGSRTLRVRLDREVSPGAELELVVDYAGSPRRGLFFVGPSPARRQIGAQAWTSFWPEDARFVLPCHDDLADKSTSEVLVTVPETWSVMASGVLVANRKEAGRRLWHYRLDRPHSLYLLAFVAGEYEEVGGEGGGVPLRYFVYRGRAEDARRTFARTPEMLALFGERSGLPYPWPKYALSVAADFVHGAMENVSAVTLADHLLLDARARSDGSSESTLAHELAHQWWGDLVTPATWNDLWISEGVATFFADLWREKSEGVDAGRWQRLEHLDAWNALSEEALRRPIVPAGPVEPWLILDANAYARAALVLAHLRQVMGEDAFWTGLRTFLGRFAESSATTADLEQAMSLALGRDLRWFFDQWLRRAGSPALHANWHFDAESSRIVLGVRQAAPPLTLPIDVAVLGPDGARTERIFVERSAQEFSIPVSEAPLSVVLDPDALLPARLDVETPPAGRLAELARGPGAAVRARAARTLGSPDSPEAAAGLAGALAADPFWGVRVEAARALGRRPGEASRDALRAGLRDPEPQVRAACAEALADEGPGAGDALLALAGRDDSDLVQAAVLRALGRSRAAGAWEALTAALSRESGGERLRLAALHGLASLGDRRALALALEHAAPGRDVRVRRAAIAVLGGLGQGQGVAVSRLVKLLGDEDRGVRVAAARALRPPLDATALEALRTALRAEDHPAFRRDLEAALLRLEGAPAH